MPQHKALYLDAKCGKFVLGYNDTPKPGNGELLVKIEAVGLNPVDWSIQKWGLFIENFPAILGTDTAGTVVEVGQGVTNFSVGDRVVYQGSWANDRASYQQFNLASAVTTAKIPNFLSFEAAATIPVCLTAAFLGLYNSKPHGAGYSPPFRPSAVGKYTNKPILIFGGAGSVGQFAIQLAKLSGFSPIITTASPKNTRYLESLGATHVIDRNLPLSSLAGAVKGVTNAPIEIVYDAVSTADTQKTGYEILAPNGSLVVVLNPEVTKAVGKEVFHVFAMPNLPHTSDISANMYSKLTEWLEEGVLLPNRVEILPTGLEGVVGGLSKLENGQVSGTKLITRPQFTGNIREPLKIATQAQAPATNGKQAEQKAVKRKSLFKRIIS
ncbi:hypothetical protein H0H87_011989 [Tephrocybe sp. NHM501043]|nr:hypothetical protein H0H87_011989 [Tephrocybe sp. NHM501043]